MHKFSIEFYKKPTPKGEESLEDLMIYLNNKGRIIDPISDSSLDSELGEHNLVVVESETGFDLDNLEYRDITVIGIIPKLEKRTA